MRYKTKFILAKYIEDEANSLELGSEIHIPEGRDYIELSDGGKLNIKRLVKEGYLRMEIERIVKPVRFRHDNMIITYEPATRRLDKSCVTIIDKNDNSILDVLYGDPRVEHDKSN